MSEPSNAVLLERINGLCEDMEEMKTELSAINASSNGLMNGTPENPGLIIRVDRLQQSMNQMRWIIAAVCTAACAEGIHILFGMLQP